MKKLALVLAIVFAGIMSANAQSSWWIGGAAGFGIQDNRTEVMVAPEIGYNINGDWTIASGLKYQFTQFDDATLGKVTVNRFIASPYVRYACGTIGNKKFTLFLDLVYDIDLLSTQMWEVGLKPGIAWKATDRFTAAFRFGFLGYDHYFERGKGIFMDCSMGTGSVGFYYTL